MNTCNCRSFVEQVIRRNFSSWLTNLKIKGKDPLQPSSSQFSTVDTTFTNIHVRTGGEVTCSKKAGRYTGRSITTIRVAEAGKHLAEEPEEACASTKDTWVLCVQVNSLIGVSPDIKS
jgi:hypothetical protein